MLRGLCDYHVGENISEIRLDVPAYFDQLQRMKIDVLTMLSKDAMGTSYYPTEAGYRNPRQTFDLVEQAVREARKRGMKLIAYYNSSLDDRLDAEHPEWRQVDAQGESPYVLRQYTAFCMNSPYRDRVRAQLLELVRNYEIDGVWFDITYIFAGRCYCENCRRLYQQRYGRPMPENPQPGSEDLAQLKQFRRDSRQNYLEDFCKAVRAVRGPDFSVGWNHAGDINFCQVEADRSASYFSVEFHAPAYEFAFLQCAWMRPFGKMIELMMSECLYGWGQWTILPQATLNTMAAVALANGGELCLGHIPVPSGPYAGRIAEPVVERFAEMASWLKPRYDVCRGAQPVGVNAILSPVADQRRAAVASGEHLEGASRDVAGAHRLLLDAQQPVDLLCEPTLKRLAEYELVMLPQVRHVPPAVVAALEEYVRNGGSLVVEGATGALDEQGQSLADFALAPLTGAHRGESSGLTARYFDRIAPEIAEGLPAMPILVQSESPMSNVTLDSDVKILARFTDPEYESRPRRHVYHQHGHPAVFTDHPAITLRSVGRGRVVYVAAPLGADYQAHGDPSLRRILQNLRDLMVPDPLFKVVAPPTVRATVMRNGKQLLIHLLHWLQNPANGPAFVEAEIPLTNIHLSVRTGENRPAAVRQIDNEIRELPFEHRTGRIEMDLHPMATHALVAIDLA